MNFLKSRLGYLLVVTVFFSFSCDSNNTGNENPPELPPAESMQFDISEMQNAESNLAKVSAESNFNTALVAAGIAKFIFELNLAIPRILINAAQQHNPNQIAESQWEWSYSTNVQGNTYGVRLTAETNTESDVTWQFFVTNTDTSLSWEDELFFEGTSDYEATSGTWTYYDISSGEQASVLSWTKSDSTASVDLEVTSNRNDNLGDTIVYEYDGTIKTVIYTDASSGESTTVSFNTENYTGFIMAPNYNNGEKSCWDSELNNVTCSPVAVP